MTSRTALALMCASMGAAVAAAGCETTTIYIETAAGGAGGATTSSSTTSSSVTGGSGGGTGCVPGETQSCYSGPAGSAGQGICKEGSQVCAADGSWGPCEGEVLPKEEDCATAEDEDCDGLAPPCDGSLAWATRFGDDAYQFPWSIATDASGNVLLTGSFNGAIEFGGGPLVSGGGGDIFVTKLDTAGAHLWSRSFGDAAVQVGASVAADSTTGEVIITGSLSGTSDFGGGPLVSAGGSDVFVTKLNAAGAHLWSERFGDTADQAGASIATDSGGNLLLTGHFDGSVDFGGGPLVSVGGSNVFVTKLDAAGVHSWSKRFGDGNDAGAAVAVDAKGSVLVIGTFEGTIDFGGGQLTSSGGMDVFLAKFDAGGGHVWSKRFGDAESQLGTTIAVDNAGNVLMGGHFMGEIDFGGGPLVSVGGYDVFVAKLDGSGGHLWSKRLGDASDQFGSAVAVDPSGALVVGGSFKGEIDFGGGPLASVGGYDIFLAKLGADGEHLWSKRFGDAGDQQASSVAMDGVGSVFLTGELNGSTNFGAGPLVSAGQADVFVAAFTP